MKNVRWSLPVAVLLIVVISAFFVASAIPDTVIIVTPSSGDVREGDVNINLTFADAANITILYNFTSSSGGMYRFLNMSVLQNHTYNFTWETNNGSFSDGTYNLSILLVNSTDASDNTTVYLTHIVVDNFPPRFTNITFSTRHPRNVSDPVTILLNASDLSNVSSVLITNGTVNLTFANLSINLNNSRYSLVFNLSDFACGDESICALTIMANDTLGHLNASISTGILPNLLYADSYAPILVYNATNATGQIVVGDVILFSANWSDVSQLDVSINLSAILEIYNSSTANFAQANTSLFQTYNATAKSNQTNFTYAIPRSFEGRYVIGRITLNDSNNNMNFTENLSFTVINQSPSILPLLPPNGSLALYNDSIIFSVLDRGSGVNLSTITLNISGSANFTITYARNASLFNCACANGCSGGTVYNQTTGLENTTCRVSTNWPLGDANISWSVLDYAGNNATNTTVYGFVNELPDIVNISINGQRFVNATGSTTEYITFTNASQEITFNWTLQTSFTLNTTALSFLNTSIVSTSEVSPAGAIFNISPGRHYVRLNTSFNEQVQTDEVLLVVTANVPLNATTFSNQYSTGHGLITGVNVTADGTDFTNTTDYVNKTIDILLTAQDVAAPTPFAAIVNYSGVDGLLVRWNATQNAFNLSNASAAYVTSLSNTVRGNVTMLLNNTGRTTLFFDTVAPFVSITVNASSANYTAYYRSAADVIQQLAYCDAVPSGVISTACFMNTSDNQSIVMYVPSFATGEQVFLATLDSVRFPAVSLLPISLQSQSVFTLVINVTTPKPNVTFCNYSINYTNTSNRVFPFSSATLDISAFSLENMSWMYRRTFTDARDGKYNVSVRCVDAAGNVNTTVANFTLTDTRAPNVTNITVSTTHYEATISADSDENATFSVAYGLTANLGSSASSDNVLVLSDSITIFDLSSGTKYYYNLSACDFKARCNITSGTFTTVSVGGSNGGAGGGGGGGGLNDYNMSVPVGAVELMDSRVWSEIAANQSINYIPRKKLAITSILLQFDDAVKAVVLGISQYNGKPLAVPATPGAAYKYFSIEHKNLETVRSRSITFVVPKTWLQSSGVPPQSISLYRLESGVWKSYAAVMSTDGTSGYRYTADVPGFSYFAVGSSQAAVSSAGAGAGQTGSNQSAVNQSGTGGAVPPKNTTGSSQGNASSDGSSSGSVGEGVIEENPELIDDASADGPFSVKSIGLLLLVIIVIAGGSVFGLRQYKEYQKREELRLLKLKVEGEKLRRGQTRGGQNQNARMSASGSGHPASSSASSLSAASGDNKSGAGSGAAASGAASSVSPYTVASKSSLGEDAADMMAQRSPEHDPMRQMHEYITRMRSRGATDDQIRGKLISVGWDNLIVDMELARR